jgi:acyl carrier protein
MATAQEIVTFTITSLEDMNFDVSDADTETMMGPSGLDLDSLAVAEIIARLEDGFGTSFAEDEIEQMAIMTLGEFADMVAQRTVPVQVESLLG